ncbi:MAG: sugar transferase [Bacteroidetes bacterium]|nr:sugar transferase [Bacteroidota bacterium]
MYKNSIKRVLDVLLATMILIVISPVLVLVMLSICLSIKSFKIFFLQDRPGKDEKIFRVVKFKTMDDIFDQNGKLLPDAVRITKVGKILRSFSLDEFPQLINVLKGEMSLIGPRPLLPEYLSKYTEEQSRRHEVRPGISGWAQINGRNEATFSERFKNDVWYVDNLSFFLDLKILLITFLKVFKSEGILDQDPNSIDDIDE